MFKFSCDCQFCELCLSIIFYVELKILCLYVVVKYFGYGDYGMFYYFGYGYSWVFVD